MATTSYESVRGAVCRLNDYDRVQLARFILANLTTGDVLEALQGLPLHVLEEIRDWCNG